MWVEILVGDNFNLFVGNNYFSPNCDKKTPEKYASF
jgi:hypothetical protein